MPEMEDHSIPLQQAVRVTAGGLLLLTPKAYVNGIQF